GLVAGNAVEAAEDHPPPQAGDVELRLEPGADRPQPHRAAGGAVRAPQLAVAGGEDQPARNRAEASGLAPAFAGAQLLHELRAGPRSIRLPQLSAPVIAAREDRPVSQHAELRMERLDAGAASRTTVHRARTAHLRPQHPEGEALGAVVRRRGEDQPAARLRDGAHPGAETGQEPHPARSLDLPQRDDALLLEVFEQHPAAGFEQEDTRQPEVDPEVAEPYDGGAAGGNEPQVGREGAGVGRDVHHSAVHLQKEADGIRETRQLARASLAVRGPEDGTARVGTAEQHTAALSGEAKDRDKIRVVLDRPELPG